MHNILTSIKRLVGKYVTRRRTYYIGPSLQFKYIFAIVFGVGIESFIVVGIFFYYYSWIQTFPSEQKLGIIYLGLLGIFLALTAVNMLIGLIFSHRIAGPLYQVYAKMKEVGRGNLCAEARFREKDELQELEHEFNSMLLHLRNLVADDLVKRDEVLKDVVSMKEKIKSSKMAEKKKEDYRKLFDELHARIGKIGNKFVID